MRKTAVLMLVLGTTTLAFAADPKGQAANGKTLYSTTCQMCHGDKGQGMVGPKLAGVVSKWKFADFKKALQKGVSPSGKTYTPTMPRYEKMPFSGTGKPPTDQQIADVLAFIKTLK